MDNDKHINKNKIYIRGETQMYLNFIHVLLMPRAVFKVTYNDAIKLLCVTRIVLSHCQHCHRMCKCTHMSDSDNKPEVLT